MQRRVLIPSLVCQSPRHSPPSSWVCLARLSFHFLFICGPGLRASPDRSPSSLKSGTASRPKADDRLAVLILSLALTLPIPLHPTPTSPQPPLPASLSPTSSVQFSLRLAKPATNPVPPRASVRVSASPRPGLVDSVPLTARRREGETTNKKKRRGGSGARWALAGCPSCPPCRRFVSNFGRACQASPILPSFLLPSLPRSPRRSVSRSLPTGARSESVEREGQGEVYGRCS